VIGIKSEIENSQYKIKMVQFIIYVSDQARSRDFYKQVLNIEPSLDVPGMTEYTLSEDCKLGIMPEGGIAKILGDKAPHPASGNGIPRCEIYLHVDDVNEYFKRAVAAGAIEVSPVQHRDWGDKVGYVSDPDGHIIAFAAPI
jgi:uncharacterized glyoxalase superfamily protein PhnB